MEYLYLYKYVPFDEGSLCIITENTLKYTHPSEFNDPFDCGPEIDPDVADDLAKHAFQHGTAIRKALKPSARVFYKQKYIQNLRRSIAKGDYWRDQVKDIGIVSLTTDPRNLLMWAHYANNHSGFVVEFQIPISAERQPGSDRYSEHIVTNIEENLIPFKVAYRSERPVLKTPLPDPVSASIDACLVKSDHWEYEHEHRVIDIKRGHGIHPYTPRRLKSVIAGMRMNDNDLATLNEAIDRRNEVTNRGDHIQLYKAEPVKGRFELHVPGHPRANEAAIEFSEADQHE